MEIDRYLGDDNPPAVPVIRFFTWDRPTISFGYNQKPGKRLDLEKCRADGISVVKRPTGGREILHGFDLCFSVIWPIDSNSGQLDGRVLFNFINDIIRKGLKRLGIDSDWKSVSSGKGIAVGPCFAQADRGEITVKGRKLVASAQRTFSSTFLQQSSIPLRLAELNIVDYMKYENKDKLRDLIQKSTIVLNEELNETISVNKIVSHFKDTFETSLGCAAGEMKELIRNVNNKEMINKN